MEPGRGWGAAWILRALLSFPILSSPLSPLLCGHPTSHFLVSPGLWTKSHGAVILGSFWVSLWPPPCAQCPGKHCRVWVGVEEGARALGLGTLSRWGAAILGA